MAQSKPRRGGQPKPAAERKRNNLTFRARDQMKSDLEKAAAAANRSLSEQIEYWLGRAIEWERVLGDLESFKADLASLKAQWPEAKRQTEAAMRHRAGWGTMYDPRVPGGMVQFPPGTHNIAQSGFVDPHAPPSSSTLPPVLAEGVRELMRAERAEMRAEMKTVVQEILQEAGLLSRKKSGGVAA